jgi:hypothetical protein
MGDNEQNPFATPPTTTTTTIATTTTTIALPFTEANITATTTTTTTAQESTSSPLPIQSTTSQYVDLAAILTDIPHQRGEGSGAVSPRASTVSLH